MKITVSLMLAALGAAALPAAQAQSPRPQYAESQRAEFEETGRVTRVQPRIEQVRQPREDCRTEYLPVQQQPQYNQQRSAGGGILGAIAGGIIGNQVGGGSGRAAATAVGAVVGAVAGDRIANPNQQNQYAHNAQYPQEQAVRQCRMVDAWESRTMGYDVTYDYRGRSYTSFMDRDPGQRIRLLVSVQPDPRQ